MPSARGGVQPGTTMPRPAGIRFPRAYVCENATMRRASLILALLAGLLAAGAHLGALDAGLLFDDAEVVRDRTVLADGSAATWGQVLTTGWWQGAGRDLLWRPLTLATFAVQKRLGAGPRGLHAVNLLLHATVTMLLFFLALKVLAPGSRPAAGTTLAAAFFAASLFGVHPLGSEAVTMVVGRADLLVAGCVLGAVASLWTWMEQPQRHLLVLAAGLTTAACLAKENGFVMPLLALLALAPWAHGPGNPPAGARPWRLWRDGLPALMAVTLPALGVLALRWLVMGRLMRPTAAALGDNPIAQAGFWEGRLAALRVLGRGVRLFFWPDPLSVDYSYAAVTVPPVDDVLVVSILAGLAALVVALRLMSRVPAALWGALFFLAAQVLTANLLVTIGTVFGERLLYLPMAGLAVSSAALALAAGTLLRSRLPRIAFLVPLPAVGILAVLMLASHARQAVYEDDLTLWSSTVAAVPRSAKARYNLGRSLAARGRHQEAADEYRTALEILPGSLAAMSNLAAEEMHLERPAAALVLLDEASRLHPTAPQVAFNRALALSRLGREGEAAAAFRRGRDLAPDTARHLAGNGEPWNRWFREALAPAPPPDPGGG
jgi:tetratricopeptide (TPR) repeat protein